MVERLIYLGLLSIFVGSVFSSSVFSQKSEIKDATRAAIFPDGSIIYYYEKTRPATEEEKRIREKWFEEEWAKLKEKSKKTVPTMEKEAEKAGEEASKEAPIILKPFFKSLKFFIKEIMKEGLRISYSIGKRHFVNQPVVVNAGFVIEDVNGKKQEVPVDLIEFYGKEEWERIPIDAVNIIISPKGNYFALITTARGIELFHMKNKEPIKRITFIGRYPFGFSYDSKEFYYREDEGSKFSICKLPDRFLSDEGAKTFLPEILCKSVNVSLDKGDWITDAGIMGNYLFVLTMKKLYVFDIDKSELIKIIKIKGYGGRSLLVSQDGVYIANVSFELYRINLPTFDVEQASPNKFYLEENFGLHFFRLVSISPNKRYIASLFDPGLIKPKGVKSWSGSTTGESRLFIWDIEEKRPVKVYNVKLEEAKGSFGSAIPVLFSPDWKYKVLHLKEGRIELWQD